MLSFPQISRSLCATKVELRVEKEEQHRVTHVTWIRYIGSMKNPFLLVVIIIIHTPSSSHLLFCITLESDTTLTCLVVPAIQPSSGPPEFPKSSPCSPLSSSHPPCSATQTTKNWICTMALAIVPCKGTIVKHYVICLPRFYHQPYITKYQLLILLLRPCSWLPFAKNARGSTGSALFFTAQNISTPLGSDILSHWISTVTLHIEKSLTTQSRHSFSVRKIQFVFRRGAFLCLPRNIIINTCPAVFQDLSNSVPSGWVWIYCYVSV